MTYHRFVFDSENRKFVGDFEGMYQFEDIESYDSWHSSSLTNLAKRIHLEILNKYNFSSILDFGCGKGFFTHLLKKANNRVIGIDISDTAINKAKSYFKDEIEFFSLKDNNFEVIVDKVDLIVCLETLSYIQNYQDLIYKFSKVTKYLYISLYIPQNPIGFVKSFDDLKQELNKYFIIIYEIIFNVESIFIYCIQKSEN